MSYMKNIKVDNFKLSQEIVKKANCSLKHFAQRCGLSRQTVYNIFINKYNTSLPTLIKICEYIGEDYHEFIK